MGIVQIVFLSLEPESKAEGRTEQIWKAHRAYIGKLMKDGKLALSGEITGDSNIREVLVFKTASIEEAQAEAKSLPAVKAGMLKAEVLAWYTARDVIKAPRMPMARSNYIFGLLVRGPKWTKEETEATKKIQEGHLANINRLAEAGKLVLAGPFENGGERRGIFIFKVDSLEEAQALTDTDPAVIAGRFEDRTAPMVSAEGHAPLTLYCFDRN